MKTLLASLWLLASLPLAACSLETLSANDDGGDTDDPGRHDPRDPVACEVAEASSALVETPTTITVKNDGTERIAIVTGPCASFPIALDGEPIVPGWSTWKCEDVPTCAGLPVPLDCTWAPDTEIDLAPGESHDFAWSGLARKTIAVPTCDVCDDAPVWDTCALAHVPTQGDHTITVDVLRGETKTRSAASAVVGLPASALVVSVGDP